MKREEILRQPAYWFENEQNEIYSQVAEYMEREGINQTQLAERLKVGKSYVSQILKGNYNFSLKKWIELCLAIGIVPAGYKPLEDVIAEDKLFAQSKKIVSEAKTEIQAENKTIHFTPYNISQDAIDLMGNDSRVLPDQTWFRFSSSDRSLNV